MLTALVLQLSRTLSARSTSDSHDEDDHDDHYYDDHDDDNDTYDGDEEEMMTIKQGILLTLGSL